MNLANLHPSAPAADEMADQLERHLWQPGFAVPERDEIEIFHERTKLYPYQLRSLGRRIGQYLQSARAVEETAANFKSYSEAHRIALPAAEPIAMPWSEVLLTRRSHRMFRDAAVTPRELSALLGAVAVNRVGSSTIVPEARLHFRPYPSGGGLYPTELYLALVRVEGIDPCWAHYDARGHALECLRPLPSGQDFAAALGDRTGVTPHAAVIVLCSIVPTRSIVKYGYRGYRFALLEAGMVMFALDLAATALGLGTLHWGGFFDAQVDAWLGLDGASESAVACLLIGRPSAPR